MGVPLVQDWALGTVALNGFARLVLNGRLYVSPRALLRFGRVSASRQPRRPRACAERGGVLRLPHRPDHARPTEAEAAGDMQGTQAALPVCTRACSGAPDVRRRHVDDDERDRARARAACPHHLRLELLPRRRGGRLPAGAAAAGQAARHRLVPTAAGR
eukprot:7367561-Prymnesium_polylepis.1